ncbi:MAG: DNA polymerase III subunit alpha [Chitinispirillaceae bacterium]
MVLLSAISHFSILCGVLDLKTICRFAKELGYSAVALTDTDNLYGLPAFLGACREYELRPIIGASITTPEGALLLYSHGDSGYSNLCRIISEKHCASDFDLLKSIKSNSDGLHLASDSFSILSSLQDTLPVYYRMTRPRRAPVWVKQRRISSLIIPYALFIDESQHYTHRLLRAIDLNTTLSRLDSKELFSSDALIRPFPEIRDRFEVFEQALCDTERFAESIQSKNDFGRFVMPEFTCSKSARELLREKAYQGARWRYGENLSDEVTNRLDYELGMIERKGFSSYFLVVDDIVKQSPRTCGRGSGAASIVAYSLGITNVDPVRYNLMFERFLNPGRVDPPDIDVDFAWDERDEVLEYVFRKYGTNHTAMVATHQTCKMRMAVREIARVFGCTEREISEVTKKMPWFAEIPEGEGQLEKALMLWPSTRHLKLDPPWPQILATAQKIIGMPRGIGTHCGGVIITPGPISSHVPVQYSAKGFPIIQWEKDGAEAMGLVKIDLLGNRSLAVIRDAIENVYTEGIDFDEQNWDPQSDSSTVDLLAKGESMGVFYVESPAMRLLQKKSGRGDFEHLVIHSSIIRPAANSYIQAYLRRLHGEPYEALHPALKEVLSETFGIMVYQEDVSKVAMAMAGFSFEDADVLRKIMSKKVRNRRFDDYRNRFFEGCRKNGITEQVIEQVWRMMLSFCGYSFCKPHSASYVQVSFQSAYMKAHYPAAFMAAVMSNYGGYYSTQAYISEAMRLGVKIHPPDVNISDVKFRSRGNMIIVGTCQIKGLVNKAQEKLVSERQEGGPYRSLNDFLVRTGIDESDAEKLILAGAFDNACRPLNRAQQFWQMRTFFRQGPKGRADAPRLRQLSPAQYLSYQYSTIGFLTPQHPITYIRYSARQSLNKIRDVERMCGKKISFLGWCITHKTVSTKRGDSMVFVTFEDETGVCETVLFPDVYNRYAWLLGHQVALVIGGKVTEEFGVKVVEVDAVRRV